MSNELCFAGSDAYFQIYVITETWLYTNDLIVDLMHHNNSEGAWSVHDWSSPETLKKIKKVH